MIKALAEINNSVDDFQDWVDYWDATDKERQQAEANKKEKISEPEAPKKKRLTAEDVLMIRKIKSETKATDTEVAKKFGITSSSVYDIVRRLTWKNI